MSDIMLQIENLSASYDEDAEVIKNVNLSVNRGEVFCLVGESGSGKSTLVRAVSGDASVRITGGNIFFDGECISDLRGRQRAGYLGKKIGFIQQNPAGAFNPIRRILPQLRETVRSHGMELDDKRLCEIFSTLNLKDPERILKSRPYELSGGMNQRIAIAASCILGPRLLLCDEITSALDVTTAIAVTDELLRLKNEMNTAVLLVTHNLGIAANIADRIGIMYDGQIVECGEAGHVVSFPEAEYTKRLLRNVPSL